MQSLPSINKISQNKNLIQEVKKQNGQNLTSTTITRRDKEWVSSPQMNELKSNISLSLVSRFLRSKIEYGENKGIFSELFVTDKVGALVAAYPLTSDYYQGDESKWIKSFNDGDCRIGIDSPDYDWSSDRKAIQVALPIFDQSRTCIGLLIAGIRINRYLDTRKAHK